MTAIHSHPSLVRCSAVWLALGACAVVSVMASDHSDAPIVNGTARVDANISDLHAFVVGENLVLALSTNTGIPPSATSYVFPSDVTFELNIDVNAAVSPVDPLGDGGTVLEPDRIEEEVTFRIRFHEDGSPVIQRVQRGVSRSWGSRDETAALVQAGTSGSRRGPVSIAPHDEFTAPAASGLRARNSGVGHATAADRVLARTGILGFFAGLRDDPFIRGPRQGRNVGSIVIETPLSGIVDGQSTLLIWATSKVEEMDGSQQEAAGRSLRSMFPEQNALNTMPPNDQMRIMGMRPDVMIFDTARAASFPNGRALSDDVVDLACSLGGECRVVASDAPFPSANDVAFLPDFPYLAPPHLAQ